MNVNIKLIQAIQTMTEIGLDMAKAADFINELEQSVSYWKSSAREFERRLDVADAAITTIKTSNNALAKEIMETNKINEGLRIKSEEIITQKDKAFNAECKRFTTRIEELFEAKRSAEVALEQANECVSGLRDDLVAETELSSALGEKLEAREIELKELKVQLLPAPSVPEVIPAPEPEVIEEPVVNPGDPIPVTEDELKLDYYFRISTEVGVLTKLIAVREISQRKYETSKNLAGYMSYHESPSTARNNKFMDLVEMYPPSTYTIVFNSEADKQAYIFARAKWDSNNSQVAAEGYDPI